ncbi:MAG: hypothetical protein C0593_00115 [Marinilabiliales bacterium]|nr:MAG: hypothetical protein C0593_00115 [Marinilabiliales bacterium]
MKRHFYLFLIFMLFVSCEEEVVETVDFRQEMRDFVINISTYAKNYDPGFLIIPQNGNELFTISGDTSGNISEEYLQSIDGVGREDLFYGYSEDNIPTPDLQNQIMRGFLNMAKERNKVILVTDYCNTIQRVNTSYENNAANGYISFAADERELNTIPDYPEEPYNVNEDQITSLSQASNFLYLLNMENYETKEEYIEAIEGTNYDLLITDLFFHDGTSFTQEEVARLRNKENGGTRILLCYLSIGEAEDYRYYWHPDWNSSRPEWMSQENPFWEGNYHIQYWNESWKDIIYGDEHSYIARIIEAGFDGAYLDCIDGFEFFE